MEPEVVFERVAPVIPVRDIDAAVERYRRLGFQVERYTGPAQYAFVERGPVSMHLHGWTGWNPGRTAMVYLYVSDADALHGEWSRAGVDGQLAGPFDTDYGLREFEYTDPEGTLHRVGSPLASPGNPA
jgi:catechol 2,3-dioxygenase-like lactoylglutathione lyase family enzyme